MLREFGPRILLVFTATLLLAAIVWAIRWFGVFGETITVYEASVQRQNDGSFAGFVSASRNDLKATARYEYYVRGEVFPCGRPQDYYAPELIIDGVPLDDFSNVLKTISQNDASKVELTFNLPKQLTNRYHNPCFKLRGGQMLGFGEVNSNTVPIQWQS